MANKWGLKPFFLYILLFQQLINQSFGFVPHPDHVVIVVLENHSRSSIVGSPAAPYINSLLNDNKTAYFSQSFALSHPSQPNYLQLFCGSDQGVRDDAFPPFLPFEAPNLGAELLAASKTFVGYSENLPYPGYSGGATGGYVRKHSPWVNWQDSPINGIPASLNQPFTSFPTDYTQLPNVCFVMPTVLNDMHDGSDPSRITNCDNWLQNNLDSFIQWSKLNNSLFILTFDEDDNASQQNILTFFTGQMVQAGTYTNHIDHYNILHVVEDMFNLPHAGASSVASTIDYCWNACYQPAAITPPGPLSYCLGASIQLSASPGDSYLWSTGDTTPTIAVSTSGNYSVTVSNSGSCTSTSSVVSVSISNFPPDGFMFNESVGTVAVNTPIATHESNNGFDNDNYIMSGTGEVRVTIPSGGYPGASAGANIYLTNTPGKNFIISGINTSELTHLELSFGVYKSRIASNGSDLQVKVSVDGTNYTPLSFTSLPTGSGTATWYYRTITGIPVSTNLSIQFVQMDTLTQFRIDDISLKYAATTAVINAGGPTSFCQGGAVSLNASYAASYAWSNGATTSSINVGTAGQYFVTSTYASGCVLTSNVINVSVSSYVTPTISIISDNPNMICSGTEVTYTAVPFNGGWAPVYQWKKNGLNVGTNNETFTTSTLSNNNTISCVLTSNASCASVPTATSNVITMTVNPTLTPSVSISSNLGNSVCAGDNVIFTATPLNGGVTPSYQWKINNVNVGGNSNTYSDNALLTGDIISCVMTSSLSTCLTSPTAVSNKDTITINLNYSPSVFIESDIGDTICPGNSVTFTATSLYGGIPSYQWNKNGHNVGTNSDRYSDNTLVTGDTISCIMTSSLSCASPITAVSNLKFLKVNPNVTPAVSITVNPSNPTCPGTNLTFTANPVNGGNNPVYQWKKNGTVIGTNSNSFSSNSLLNNDIITCSLTSNYLCVTGNPASSNSISVSLQQPVSVLNFNPSSGSSGNSIVIIGTNFTGITAVKFNGINSSFTINSSSQITAIVPPAASTGLISISTNCNTASSTSSFNVISSSVVLNLKAFIEGYYRGNGAMVSAVSPGISENITVELHSNLPPYNTLYSASGTINSSGNGAFEFPPTVNNNSYYIVIVNPNTLKIWSSAVLLFSPVSNYDFTTASGKAFGNNMKDLGDGKFALYSGDVNQDGLINNLDFDLIKNSTQLFQAGYLTNDLTGDNLIESSDFSLVENNLGKSLIKP